MLHSGGGFDPASLGLAINSLVGFNGTTFTSAPAVYAASGVLITVTAGATGDVPLVSKAFSAGQTGSLQEWRSSADAVLVNVDAAGRVVGGTGNLTLRAGSGSGSNAVLIQNDVGTTLLTITRNSGYQLATNILFSTGNTYDIGTFGGNNGPRDVAAQRTVYAKTLNVINDENLDTTPATAAIFEARTGFGPAAGYGTSVFFRCESSTTNSRDQGAVTHTWVVATDASRTARVVHSVYDTAARECLRMEASGSAAMIGFLGAAATVRSAAYTPTNVTPDRGYDANATSIDEIADVLGTLIADLQEKGLIG